MGLRNEKHDACEETFYIIPPEVMSTNVRRMHKNWAATEGKNGNAHDEKCSIRKVRFGSVGKNDKFMFDVSGYKGRWDLIEEALERASKTT